jgi:hypothetical protein
MLDARRREAGLTPARIAGWRRIVLLATIVIAPLVVVAGPEPSGAQQGQGAQPDPCEPIPSPGCDDEDATTTTTTRQTTTTRRPTPTTTPTTVAPPPPEVTEPPEEEAPPPPDEEDDSEADDESAAIEEVAAPAESANLTFTPINDLLVPGNGIQGAQPTTTTTTTAPTGSGSGSADEDSRLMWMIIAALAGVGLLVAILTWRYWLLTRPGLAFDDDDDQEPGATGGPGGRQPRGRGPRTAVPDPYTSAMPSSPAARRARSGESSRPRRRRDEGDPFWDDPGGGPGTTALGVGGLPGAGGTRRGSPTRGAPAGMPPPAPPRGGRPRPPGPDADPPARGGAGGGRRRSGRGGDPRGGPPPADGRRGRPGSGSGRRARDDRRGGGAFPGFPGPSEGGYDDMWGDPRRR